MYLRRIVAEGKATRRRGAELEAALLDAAWEELVAAGYGGFTIEGVAERARTSRPVVYRRWPTRTELVAAALRHHAERDPIPVPDTGSLRADLIALLQAASARRSDLAVLISVQLGGYFAETRTAPQDLRERFLVARGVPTGLDEILRRAAIRGEIDPARLTPRRTRLAFDLLRHELLMTQQPVPQTVIEEIVDDIALPLLTPPG
jgi:AcrR family transcriptional regulator